MVNSRLRFARNFILAERTRLRSSQPRQAAKRWQQFLKQYDMLRTFIFTLSFIFLFLSCNSQQVSIDNLFQNCSPNKDTFKTVESDLFKINYPIDWNEEKNWSNGLKINSYKFPDSLKRGFLLSVVPYDETYLKKNDMLNYVRFEEGKYKDYDAVFLSRNDMKTDKPDMIYWRNELKIIDPNKKYIYILVFGKTALENSEPTWCEFNRIINSLEIKR